MQQQFDNANRQHGGGLTSSHPRETVLNSESQNRIINEADNATGEGGLEKAADTFFPAMSKENSNDKSVAEKIDSPSIDDEEIIEEDDDMASDKEIEIEEEGVDEESPEIIDEEEKGKVF